MIGRWPTVARQAAIDIARCAQTPRQRVEWALDADRQRTRMRDTGMVNPRRKGPWSPRAQLHRVILSWASNGPGHRSRRGFNSRAGPVEAVALCGGRGVGLDPIRGARRWKRPTISVSPRPWTFPRLQTTLRWIFDPPPIGPPTRQWERPS